MSGRWPTAHGCLAIDSLIAREDGKPCRDRVETHGDFRYADPKLVDDIGPNDQHRRDNIETAVALGARFATKGTKSPPPGAEGKGIEVYEEKKHPHQTTKELRVLFPSEAAAAEYRKQVAT